ncbi:MaoC family dehydratase [Stappia sp. F7233]|uniref:MaoC family dehydratase n=1 Tax=Stappia albiluteola TaxID=2758565 RepID=A0A839A9M7_9HYPH|nr:MaoC family dehydratase [Stappia albiluteola]MBA5775744.1 MaoC family dehydratase [Stappia albiluteola]
MSEVLLGAESRRIALGSFTFTADDIVRFACAYDPQRFHLSEEDAAKTHFGRLCASGWHTAAVWMKLMVAYHQHAAEEARRNGGRYPILGPSPGFEDLKWLKPVFAGDTISYFTTALKVQPSRSRPGWGLLFSHNEGVNQNGEAVFSFEGRVFVALEDTSVT